MDPPTPYEEARRLLREGRAPDEVVRALERRGVDLASARLVVAELTARPPQDPTEGFDVNIAPPLSPLPGGVSLRWEPGSFADAYARLFWGGFCGVGGLAVAWLAARQGWHVAFAYTGVAVAALGVYRFITGVRLYRARRSPERPLRSGQPDVSKESGERS